MSSRRKRRLKAQHAINARWNPHLNQEENESSDSEQLSMRELNPDVAVIRTLVQGSNYRRARLGAAIQGTSFPSRSTFYRHQKELLPQVQEKSLNIINKYANESFSQGANVSVDGRYDSCQMYCVYNRLSLK